MFRLSDRLVLCESYRKIKIIAKGLSAFTEGPLLWIVTMIIKRDIWYPPMGQNRTLHIYLPDDYGVSQVRYPVMYFFDGHNLFYDSDATYGKSWGLKEFLDGWDKKMIIAGMECGHGENERLSEYLPYHPRFGMFSRFQARGDATFQWIVNDVKPLLDREYRTYGHREATAVGGSSMGGLMSVYGIVKYNHIFSKGACVSSAIGFCMPQLMNDMNRCSIHPDTRAFLSWGTQEAGGLEDIWNVDVKSHTYRANRAVYNKFEACGAIPRLYCQVGGRHCEADWEKQVPELMEFLWK